MVYPLVQYRGPAYPDLSQRTSPATSRELDSRISDGIHVRLLWHPGDGHLSVAVHDTKTGDAFELPLEDSTRVLDVYRHPYAYAGERPGVGGSFPHSSHTTIAA